MWRTAATLRIEKLTHYTILTIKKQLLKLQFIYSINGDGSKTAKKSLKR